MAESVSSTLMRSDAFRAPGSVEWRPLVVPVDSDKATKDEAASNSTELKGTLLASLQMQHLVVLAGSGCSLSAGGPSMKDLWNDAVGAKPTDAATATATAVRHDIDQQDLEMFLSKIEAFQQVRDDKRVKQFLNASKKVILDRCSSFLQPGTLEAHKTFLHRLSRRRVRDHRLKIFTTNYDICFERAAGELGGVVLDGFSFTAPRRYDPRFFSYDIVRRPRGGEDLGNYLEGVFLLYKLHGSVNWMRTERGEICESEKPDPESACLIYPASGKYAQSFTQPHLESMAQYLAALREPNTCVLVVGFGFRDDHLAEPLLAAARSNPHLRLIIVDPDARARTTPASSSTAENGYWREFATLALSHEDIWFVAARFHDFAAMIPDLKSLTPADKLMKAIQDVTRER